MLDFEGADIDVLVVVDVEKELGGFRDGVDCPGRVVVTEEGKVGQCFEIEKVGAG